MGMSPAEHERMLARMGITVWRRRSATPAATPAGTVADEPEAASRARTGATWEGIEGAVRECTGCPLHRTRTRAVPGEGARRPKWMIVGEAPGANEDRSGQPFVGRAGRLLEAMLFACGAMREDVYITNVVKCRPPSNRDPSPIETGACRRYLEAQVKLAQPRVILATGRIAARILLGTGASIARLRGTVHELNWNDEPIDVIVTYHPAYLLRDPAEKRKSWADLKLAMSRCLPGPDEARGETRE